ncbi:MAG: hypothetical protein N2441_04380 [Rhodocyclaceae bacterium]|nr:hypothetical protein [Rhodocyclaceae bacterium]
MRAALGAFLFSFVATVAQAELVVVTSPQTGIERLSREEVINIFLGRYRLLPVGITAEPLDLPIDHPARAQFYQRLVGKHLAEINAYWARLIFSGRTRPPRVVSDYAEAIRVVRERPGALAYLDASSTPPDLKVIFSFED